MTFDERIEEPKCGSGGFGMVHDKGVNCIDDEMFGHRRQELSSFSFAGLQAVLEAAEKKWGEPHELEELREAARTERARIDQMLG